MKNEKIYLSRQDALSMMEKFRCSRSFLSDSLSFKYNSQLSQRIRGYAMNFLPSACIVKC